MDTVLKMYFSRSLNKLKEFISKFKKVSKEKYKKYSNPSFIKILYKNGLNINIDQDIATHVDKSFYFRLIWFIFNFILLIYQGIGCIVYWDDLSMTYVIGNWIREFGLPLVVIITAVHVVVAVAISPFLFTSYLVLNKDKNLHLLIQLMKTIANTDNDRIHENGFTQKFVKEIQTKIRPMIAIIRIWIQHFLPTVAFGMVITNFFVRSKSWLVSPFELVLMILWAKHFSIVGGQLTRIVSTSILTLIVISQYLFLELDCHGNNCIPREPSTSRQRMATDIKEHIRHQVNAISKIRKYNQVMKYIVGCTMTSIFLLTTCQQYLIQSPYGPVISKIVCGVNIPLYVGVFNLHIFLSGLVNKRLAASTRKLVLQSKRVKFDFRSRFKFMYILKGMEHSTCFGFFDFIPQLYYPFIIWVRVPLMLNLISC